LNNSFNVIQTTPMDRAVMIAMAKTIGFLGLTGFTVDEALSTTRLSETLAA
jgi:hypothetical protein